MPVYSYDDLGEFVAASFLPVRNASNARYESRVLPSGFMCGDRRDIKTYERARRALDNPLFPQGVERIERLAREIEAPAPVSIKRRIVRDAQGDELDIQRVWQGDLDHAWTHAKRTRTPATARILIGVYVSASADTASERLAWRGVAALALANALEAASYMVEIRAIQRCNLTDSKSTPHDINVTVKAAGVPIDIHKSANMLATPLLFRGIMFRHYLAHAERHITNGFGYSSDERRNDVHDRASWDFVVVAGPEIRNIETAQRWVNEQTAALETANAA